MKIALLNTLYSPYNFGGAEKAVLSLAESLASRAHQVIVISLCPQPPATAERRNDVLIYRLPIQNIYWPYGQGQRPGIPLRVLWHMREIWNSRAARQVELVLKRECPDVLHTHNITAFSPSVWRVAREMGIPVIHTLHDYSLLCTRTSLFRSGETCARRCLGCRIFTMNRRPAGADVNTVVGVSKFVLERHLGAGYFAHAQARVIHNILPAASQPIRPETREAAGPLRFGFIGRIEREKGIELLLDVCARLSTRPWTLSIAGTGVAEYVRALRRRYDDRRIHWLGYVAAEEFYRSVDVVVIPSLWPEPLPYTCVEALLAGRSILASDTGGIPEIVQYGGLYRLFPCNQGEALQQAMEAALDAPAEWRRVQPVSDDVLWRFSEERVSEAYLNVYSQAVQGEQRSADIPAAVAR